MKLILIYLTNNPTAYGGAQPLRQTVLFVFIPDPNGMRYKKKVDNVTTNYYYNGTQLLMEDRGGGADRIYYIYGASARVYRRGILRQYRRRAFRYLGFQLCRYL